MNSTFVLSKREFVKRFVNMLAEEGDTFFSSGDVRQDYYTIVNTIDTQGYWAGIRLRYYFDSAYELLNTEERRFGNADNL